MRRYINPPSSSRRSARSVEDEQAKAKKFPERPQRDVLLFLLEHAPLEDWERDILAIVREEAYYFAPQGKTKIMNEGWASYWHSHDHDHAGAAATPRSSTTPTTTPAPWARGPARSTPTRSASSCSATSKTAGTRAASARSTTSATTCARARSWDKKLGLGRQKIFEVRKHYNDVTFIDEFLTAGVRASSRSCSSTASTRSATRWEILDREFQQGEGEAARSSSPTSASRSSRSSTATTRTAASCCSRTSTTGWTCKGDYAQGDAAATCRRCGAGPSDIVTRVDGKGVMLRFDGQTTPEKKVEL